MKASKTAHGAHVTERQKAWGRLALLTVVGLVCPPLAAARSGTVWGVYLLLLVIYSLWTVRITRNSSRDTQLGYLLCAADLAVLMPIMVWSLSASMSVLLMLLWAMGVGASFVSARTRRSRSRSSGASHRPNRSSNPRLDKEHADSPDDEGAPLERALRARLRLLETDGSRFALVLLKLGGYETMIVEQGKQATRDFLHDVGHRGLRLLGPDAQVFPLPGGRMAFVFATDFSREGSGVADPSRSERVEPHDIETLAMSLAGKACDHTLGGHRLECVAGWASAPADGVNVDDLVYTAESGALSTDAYRRVGASRVAVPEPEQKRAIAG